jgi:hypothetical protein
MQRRRFVSLILTAAAGAVVPALPFRASLDWSAGQGFPGMPVRLSGLPRGVDAHDQRRLVVLATRAGADTDPQVLLDLPLASAPQEWRLPGLRRGSAPQVFELHAQVREGQRVVAATTSPLTVRYRRFGFST